MTFISGGKLSVKNFMTTASKRKSLIRTLLRNGRNKDMRICAVSAAFRQETRILVQTAFAECLRASWR
ncbi:hypothetical protein AVEN_185525-1, partial [Araneus ventricosus]